MENTPNLPTESHLLDDLEYNYVQPGSGVRFSNYLIDRLLLYGSWQLALYFFKYQVGMFVYNIAGREKWAIYTVSYLLALLYYTLYFTIFEGSTGGKTVGKLITRTRAVTEDGQRIGFKEALIRSLCRMIPFEPFSAFGQ